MDAHIPRQARRIVAVLFLAQSAGSAGVIAASTVNPILGASLGGDQALAGVPSGIFLTGTALGALAWGLASTRLGRRGGLILGAILGAIGAAVSGLSVIAERFDTFLAGLFLMGASLAAFQLARFIAADVNPPQMRGRAISNVILGGAVGSIVGPLLVGPLSRLAAGAGFDELAGPFLATFVLEPRRPCSSLPA